MIEGTGNARHFALVDGYPGTHSVVPDRPGCTAAGSTPDHAILETSAVVADWTSTVESGGGTVPPASPAKALRREPETAGALVDRACLVAVQAELGQAAQDIPLHDRFAALRAAYPLPPATGEPADKALFDEMSGEPS